MDPVRAPPEVVVPGNYETTRFNALRHGVLSRYTVLPWEDEAEYQSLLDRPWSPSMRRQGRRRSTWSRNWPGSSGENGECGWRRRRYIRQKLRHKATDYHSPEHIAGAALLPLTGAAEGKANIPRAIAATAAETARDLRETKRDQGMTQRALHILDAGDPGAYERG